MTAQPFAVRLGDIRERADVNFAAAAARIRHYFAQPRYPLVTLADIADLLQYGSSAPASTEPIGPPVLRMNNLQDEGWDLTDLKYLDLPSTERASYRLAPGDILFNRTNSKELVGKCAVFREEGEWLFASYLIRVRVDESRAMPEFVAAFMSTAIGRAQIDRLSRQIVGMSNINAQEIRSLLIPLPPLGVQRELTDMVSGALAGRSYHLREARKALADVDEVLFGGALMVGAHVRHPGTHGTFLRQISEGGRLDPEYYHPERQVAITAVKGIDGSSPVKLGSAVEFVRDVGEVADAEEYTGLANVASHTGERVGGINDDAADTGFRYETGDVLFARLRPYLNKVYRAERRGVCSTEFYVLRAPASETSTRVLPDYLAAVLRSSLVVKQTVHMMTGNTHPRLSLDDAQRLLIPVPAVEAQERVIAELAESCQHASALREEAQREYADARERFEAQLVGPA